MRGGGPFPRIILCGRLRRRSEPQVQARFVQVQTINLTKTYPGNITAVHPMNVQFTDGIIGLLGPNGAGKTTLMRMLATLLEPSSGTALVDGHDIRYDKPSVRALLGYLPQEFGLYPSLSVVECLDYMGLLAGLGRAKDRRARIEELLERVNLTEYRKRKVGEIGRASCRER